MLKNENIICISTIDWDFLWQGHQEIMSTFVKNGNKVIFIENMGVRIPRIRDISRIRKRLSNYFRGVKGIRKEANNLYVFSPIVLPFPYSRIARMINKRILLSALEKWMKVMNFSDSIIWTFLPTGITLDIAENFNYKLLVYYCIDNLSASSFKARKIKATENKLLKKADLVFVTSQALYDMCSEYSKSVTFFPFGVSLDNFVNVREQDNYAIPEDLAKIKDPVIGYVGGIHKWIDFVLLKSLADKYPQYSFVFIGPIQTDVSGIEDKKNMFFLGNKNHKDLPYYINNFQVGIIPYIMSDYTKNVYPTKLNEYLSMGKPVIATGLPEIVMFNQRHSDVVYIGDNAEEFGQAIEKAIKEDSEFLKEKRVLISEQNSWETRIEEMSNLITKAIENKMLDNNVVWRDQLLLLYRATNRKIRKLVLAFFLFYTLFFYTPFVWFLGRPLKILQVPKKADCIVVFGGGVGESGRPAQGYEERVQYAVELYKLGYVKNILFSSGYMYVFEEPLIMKVLAVSLGVPESAILLESQARNTYENVIHSSNIVLKNGWKSILVVSSPYHMLRVKMVFDKNVRDLKVIYSPVPNSIFYLHNTKIFSKWINLRQVKGIIHEYLGILYYWRQGWI